MLFAGEHCIDKNEIIEKTWKNVLINWIDTSGMHVALKQFTVVVDFTLGVFFYGKENKQTVHLVLSDPDAHRHSRHVKSRECVFNLGNWINNCVKPKKAVSELNERCFSEVVKRCNKSFCIDETEKIDPTDFDIKIFLERHYPKLRSREMNSFGRAKKFNIAMAVVLYHFYTKDKSGKMIADVFEMLEKNEMQMILNFCEGMKQRDVTAVNVESAIKDAYDKIHMKTINKLDFEVMVSQIPDKEITGILHTEAGLKNRKRATKSMTTLNDSKNVKLKDNQLLDAKSFLEMSEIGSNYLVETRIESNHRMDRLERMYDRPSDSPDEDVLEMSVHDSVSECVPYCDISKCTGKSCGDVGYSTTTHSSDTQGSSGYSSKDSFADEFRRPCDWKLYFALGGMIVLAVILVMLCSIYLRGYSESTDETETEMEAKYEPPKPKRLDLRTGPDNIDWEWQCIDQFCVKAHVDKNLTKYKSLSRCTLLCMGPQLWPYPIGYMHFSKEIVALTTAGIEYKFQSVPSEIVHTYLAEAFKLFLKGLFRLENIDKKLNRSQTIDLQIKRISVSIEVENDPDPRLRLNTEESYMLNFETIGSRTTIKVISGSFCGVRHGLETASQLILLDQATGYLLSHSDLTIKDAPSFKYRGLMLDTGRNYISVTDIMRTVDAMAACKLNTLHWRISSETSFPLYLPQLPLLYEYGAYDRTLVYTKNDVKSIVRRAGLRGIRVLIEVTAPGPVGRAWSWTSEATCPKKTDNYTCDNILCTRLLMEKSVFDALEFIYSEILQMTGVDDIFHLSDGMFSLTNCYQLISDRDGFLERALEKLKKANKGFLPKLPIIWYTSHLMKDSEAKTWDKMGVQLNQWDPNPGEQYLGKFRVIHSTKWDLSCETSKHRCVKFKTWQEMYSWKSWRSIEVFAIEGGEAILWTDLIGPGNLDLTLWPRAAAVAERLWSDSATNSSANRYVYVRLDTHRWRMLLRGIKVQPIWPAWCSFNPSECAAKIRK